MNKYFIFAFVVLLISLFNYYVIMKDIIFAIGFALLLSIPLNLVINNFLEEEVRDRK